VGLFRNLINAAVGAAAAREVSGKSLMKQTAKQYGVDTGRIPENAWDEMTANCINQARTLSSLGVSKQDFATELVNAAEGTANLIASAMEPGNRSPLATGWVRDILVKHGTIKG
jgi:hypothetical protein